MFEPFLQDGTFNFALRSSKRPIFDHYQPYVPASAEPGEWNGEIDRILRGEIRHWWCDRFNSTGIYRRRVIKAVRINLMLDYVAERWPGVKIVFVLRDPLSVVNSQIAMMKQGWVMQWKPEFALHQPRLMADWLEPFRQLIESSHGVVRRQAMKWCIENLVPLSRLPRRGNALIVRYDELVQNPQRWSAVADFLADRNWNVRRFMQVVNRVSPVARRNAEQISRRLEDLAELDEIDQQSVLDVVRAFGLDHALRPTASPRQAA